MLRFLVLLGDDPPRPDPGTNGIMFLLPIIFIVFYMLILRPHKKQEQERMAMVKNLKKNDEVLTNAGIYGTVVDVSETDDKITVKVADNVRVKMTKGSVLRNLTNEEAAKEAKAAKEVKA